MNGFATRGCQDRKRLTTRATHNYHFLIVLPSPSLNLFILLQKFLIPPSSSLSFSALFVPSLSVCVGIFPVCSTATLPLFMQSDLWSWQCLSFLESFNAFDLASDLLCLLLSALTSRPLVIDCSDNSTIGSVRQQESPVERTIAHFSEKKRKDDEECQ